MKKGFTIIELLATLTILLLVASILIPTMLNMADDVRSKQYASQKELILSAAREYGEDNINALSSNCTNISVQTLITYGYLKADSDSVSGEKTTIRDARDNERVLNCLQVCVKYEFKTSGQQSSGVEKNYYKVTATLDEDQNINTCINSYNNSN